MITKKQYNTLKGHKDMLMLFRSSGEAIGNLEPLYNIHKEITGRQALRGCSSCLGEILIDCINILEKYERT